MNGFFAASSVDARDARGEASKDMNPHPCVTRCDNQRCASTNVERRTGAAAGRFRCTHVFKRWTGRLISALVSTALTPRTAMAAFLNISTYRFTPLEELPALKQMLQTEATARD
jgi:hypothetical protein